MIMSSTSTQDLREHPLYEEEQQTQQAALLNPRCIASTSEASSSLITHNTPNTASRSHSKYNYSFFKEAQLSADGSTIVSHNVDRSLRTFVLPENLEDESKQPHTLTPTTTLPSPTNIQSYALYPGFTQSDPTTNLVLSAPTDLPIRLTNLTNPTSPLMTYPFIHPPTEAYQSPHSLAWSPFNNHFIAGSKGSLAIFDANVDASGPIATHNNSPRNPSTAISSMRDSGLIMSLAISGGGALAAGSSNRSIGIFSTCGQGPCETAFSVAPARDDPLAPICKGTGVTSLAWSPDGTYLLAAERQSDGIHVFDVRSQRRRLAWLAGRNALTPQRLGISTVQVMSGVEVWAGGKDGAVRMWRNPGWGEGVRGPDGVFEGVHGDPVGSVVWGPGGREMVTCSGQRRVGGEDSDDEEEGGGDSSLKVWSV